MNAQEAADKALVVTLVLSPEEVSDLVTMLGEVGRTWRRHHPICNYVETKVRHAKAMKQARSQS